MSDISEWSIKEAENTHLDELTLSGEGGQYINKVMCAVKAKADEVDGKLDAVAGGLVWRGTKETYADLEAVENPVAGDMYSVTALGGENYAWTGTAWDSLGTSDANVVHKDGFERIPGQKVFENTLTIKRSTPLIEIVNTGDGTSYADLRWKSDNGEITTCGRDTRTGDFILGHTNAGSAWHNGSRVDLMRDGSFSVSASGSSPDYARVSLVGDGTGSLSWDGQPLQTTSDARLKTPLSSVPDDVLDAWGDVGWGQFQFLDAVERKGQDVARLHLGLVAQAVKAAFDAHGIDACVYGILCHVEQAAASAVYDDAGELVFPARDAFDLWTVRYAEAQAMEAAYQRRRADRLEARIDALEAQLHGND